MRISAGKRAGSWGRLLVGIPQNVDFVFGRTFTPPQWLMLSGILSDSGGCQVGWSSVMSWNLGGFPLKKYMETVWHGSPEGGFGDLRHWTATKPFKTWFLHPLSGHSSAYLIGSLQALLIRQLHLISLMQHQSHSKSPYCVHEQRNTW